MAGRPWSSLLRYRIGPNASYLMADTCIQVKEFIEDPRKMLLSMG